MKRVNILFLFLFAFALASCETNVNASVDDFVLDDGTPIAGVSVCHTPSDRAFNLSLGKWDKDEILYTVLNWPEGVPKQQVKLTIRNAFKEIGKHASIPCFEVEYPNEKPDIEVSFRKHDGIGGQMGESYFPPQHESDKYPVPVWFDEYDILFDGRTISNPGSGPGILVPKWSQVVKHELSHSFGLRHSDYRKAVMWRGYEHDHTELWIDDVLGIREKYENKDDFKWNGHLFKYYEKNDLCVSTDFLSREFVGKCDNYYDGNYLDAALVTGLQIIRDHYGVPIEVVSGPRTHDCNAALKNASSNSMHLVNMAIDWSFQGSGAIAAHQAYQSDIINGRKILSKLLDAGIRGLGGYTRSNHIDTRDDPGVNIIGDYKYAMWGTLVPNSDRAYTTGEDGCAE